MSNTVLNNTYYKKNSFNINQEIELIKDSFNKNGFVILKKVISIDLIKKVKKDLLELVKMNKIKNLKRDIHLFKNGEISSAHNLFDYLPSYKDLMDSEGVLKFISSLYKNISEERFNSSYFAKPKSQGLETKPHQDNAFFCMEPADIATCWMPLTFANKINGCLYYYKGSHKLGNLEHVPEGNLGASMCVEKKELEKVKNNFEKTYIELEKGDCIIHNSLVVHGSEANTSQFDRNAFNFSIGSKFAVRNNKLYEAYVKKLNDYLKKKKT